MQFFRKLMPGLLYAAVWGNRRQVSRQQQAGRRGQRSRDGIDDDGVGGLIAVDASFKRRADRGRGLDDDLIPWTLGAGPHGEVEGGLGGVLVRPTADLMYC